MFYVILAWVVGLFLNLAIINAGRVGIDKEKDVGLFDWVPELWFVYLLGPIGTALLLVALACGLIEYLGMSLASHIKCPEWLKKFNPKIS